MGRVSWSQVRGGRALPRSAAVLSGGGCGFVGGFALAVLRRAALRELRGAARRRAVRGTGRKPKVDLVLGPGAGVRRDHAPRRKVVLFDEVVELSPGINDSTLFEVAEPDYFELKDAPVEKTGYRVMPVSEKCRNTYARHQEYNVQKEARH